MDAHKNFAVTDIAIAPTPAASGLSATVSDASVFPATPFNATICPVDAIPTPANAEIVRVTNIVGNVLTFTRAQEGTSARTVIVGDLIAATITVKVITDIENALPPLLSAINVSAGVVSQNLSALTFSNANGVSFGLNASVVTATVRTDYQPAGAYLTTAALSQDSSKYAGTNGAITGGSITVNTAGVSVNLPAYLTTAAQSNHSHGNPQLNLTNLSGTTASNSGGFTLSLSAANPGGGVTGISGVSLSGNTAGVLGLISSGTVVFAGGNNITVSQDGQSVTISGPNAAGAQTGISGIAVAGATATSGTVLFSNEHGVSFGLNGNTVTASIATTYAGTGFTSAGNNIGLSGTLNTAGLSLSATVAAQSSQSAIKGFGVSDTGQTAGNTGLSTGIDWVLAGSQSITLSQSTAVGGPNTVWVQHPAWLTTAAQSNAVVQSINGSTGTFSFNTGSSLSSSRNGNAITFGLASDITTALQSTGAYLTTAALSSQTLGFSLSGNIATTNSSRISNGAYALAGGNNVTIQQSNNTVSISVGNYITTARASTDAIGLNTAQSNVTWTVNSSGLSLDARGYAGTVTGATGASLTVNSSGVSINLPAYLTTADLSANSSKYVQNWKLTGNTAGTTSSAQGTDLWFQGGNSITVSGSSNSIVFSVGAYLTTARASTDAIGLNTAQSNVTWTVNSSGLSFDARGYAGTGTSGVNATLTLNSGGLTVSVAAPGAAAENNWIALTGNTAGNTTASGSTIAWSGGNGVTLSGTNGSNVVISVSTYSTVGTATSGYPVASANSIGTITRWAAEDHRHAGIGGFGISTSGNTAGTTGSVQGTYWVQGGNSITVSQITSNNGSHTLVISAGAYLTNAIGAIGISTGNTLGTSGSVQGSYWIQGSNNISVSQITSNNGSHTLNILGDALVSQYDPFQGLQPITNSTLGQSTIYFVPFDVMAAISASRINFFMSVTHTFSGAPNNQTAWNALGYALYTRGTGASSERISTVTSYSLSWFSGSVSSSTRLSVTNYVGLSNAVSHTTSQYGVNNASVSDYLGSSIAGYRVIALPMNLTLTPGRYWLGMSNQTASQINSFIVGQSIMQVQLSNNLAFRPIGVVSAGSNASAWGMSDGFGTYSAQTAAFPDTIPLTLSHIKVPLIGTFPYFNFSGISTGAQIL